MDTKSHHRHGWAPRLALLLLLGMLFLQASEALGDGGKTMAVSYALVAAALLLGFGWLILASGYPLRTRLGVPIATVLMVAATSRFVHIDGWLGDMSPELRFGERQEKVLPRAGSGTKRDLSMPGPDDSPIFLGLDQDCWADLRIETDWEVHPPQELWRRDVGEGWSSFAIVSGVAITQERRGLEQAITAYDLFTGELQWIHSWSGVLPNNLGGPGPRGTPTVSGGLVFAVGSMGKLVCLDGGTGQLVWERELPAEHGVDPATEREAIAFGRANSPLVHNGTVIVPVGGRTEDPPPGLVGLMASTGETLWESPGRNVSYASPVLATLLGTTQVLVVHESSAAGHDPATGQILWEHPWPGGTSSNASCSNPVPIGPDGVLLSKGYGIGSTLLQLSRGPDGIEVREEWAVARALQTKFTNIVIYGDIAVGLSDGILMAANIEDGRRAWKMGRYGHGQVLGVGEHLLVLSESGELLAVDPSPAGGGSVLAKMEVLEGKTWNQPALAGNILLLRNASQAVALRLPVAEGK